jgi:hypothetical protein
MKTEKTKIIVKKYGKKKEAKGKILYPDQMRINRFLTNHFLQKTLDHPNTPETIRKARSLSAEGELIFFKYLLLIQKN